ncbi:MAG TPA: hypothetical protein VGQ95_08460, partial [Chthoniobacterales bacterium]|nr:hypothetical protein [Chthoniobacterales bacterium]
MQFPSALETVLTTLERIRDENLHRPRVSRATLETLNRCGPQKIDINETERAREPKIDRLASVQARV